MSSCNIKSAIILAAGMGSRLKPVTGHIPKCMVEIAGAPLLAHTVETLLANDFERLVVVTGYNNGHIENFLRTYAASLCIETIHNEQYANTNNIYSLWLAADHFEEGVTLLESDVILEPSVMKQFRTPDRIALDLFCREKHCGSTATVDENNMLRNLYVQDDPPETETLYKTVNMYSFSSHSWKLLCDEMKAILAKDIVNVFYESAIQNLIVKETLSLEMVSFVNTWWDEIDTPEDLQRVHEALETRDYLLKNRKLVTNYPE